MTEEKEKAIEIVKNIPYKHKEIFMHENLAIAKVLSIIRKQQKEIGEKDKIIDEILKELINQYGYFEPCYLDGEMGCEEYKKCEDCVKRYIEKKVEGNK